MTDEAMNQESHELAALFRTYNAPIADADFTGATLDRIESHARRRRLLLGGAVAVGVAFAAVPIAGLADSLGSTLISLATHWQETGWLAENWLQILGSAAIAAWAAALRA